MTNAQVIVGEAGAFPECSICGSGTSIANTLDTIPTVPTTDGFKTCVEVQQLGFNGAIADCDTTTGLTTNNAQAAVAILSCGCGLIDTVDTDIGNPGDNPVCAICGPGRTVANVAPIALVPTNNDGIKTCLEFQLLALNGAVSNCDAVTGFSDDIDVCLCTDIPSAEPCNVCGEDDYIVFNPSLTVNAADILNAVDVPVVGEALTIPGLQSLSCRQYEAIGNLGFIPAGDACTTLQESEVGDVAALACGCAPENFTFLSIIFEFFCLFLPFLCG